MADAPFPYGPETTASFIELVQYTRYGTLVTTTILAWDILTTLDREIKHIWRLRWGFSKIQFLALRYGTFFLFLYQSLMIISPTPSSTCRNMNLVNTAVSSTIMVAVSFILILRTWALYDRRRTVLGVLIGSYVIAFTPAIAVMMLPSAEYFSDMRTFAAVKDAASRFNGDMAWLLGGCYVSGWSTGFVVLVVSFLVYETGLFAATAYKLWPSKSSATLIRNLFRDGTIYYLLMLGTLVGAAVGSSNLASVASRAFVASGYFVGLKVIACSHMFLQLRIYLTTSEAYIEGVLQTSDDGLSFGDVHSEVRFADPMVLRKNKDEFELESKPGSFAWTGKVDWIRGDDGHGAGEETRSASSTPQPSLPELARPPPTVSSCGRSSWRRNRHSSLMPALHRASVASLPAPTFPLPAATLSGPSRKPSSTFTRKRSMGSITITRFEVWDETPLPVEGDESDDEDEDQPGVATPQLTSLV